MTENIPVPDAAAPLRQIWEFALTYNGYQRRGGSQGAGDLANRALARYEEAGELPEDMDDLRCALFFEQRRWRHYGYDPSPADQRYFRALVRRISEIGHGTVPGPPD